MQELARERAALKAMLTGIGIETFVYEDDALARPHSIRDTFLDEIEAADLYLGLFAHGYGAYTVEEYEHAQSMGLPCLVFEKHDGQPRETALQSFLDRIGAVDGGDVTPARFADVDELVRKVRAALQDWRARDERQRRERPAPVVQGVPARPPAVFVGREALLAAGAARLRAGEDLAIEGLSGAGKTTLAAALVQHRGVARRFRDGVLWASLGPQADVGGVLAAWADALDPSGALSRAIADGDDRTLQRERLREVIGTRDLLLVIDDAWEREAAIALRCGGPRCAHLLTTRDKGVARTFLGGAGALTLVELAEADAVHLLQRLAPEACAADPEAAHALVRAVGGLPQALRLVGAQLAGADAGLFAEAFPELGQEAFETLADPAERLKLAGERLGARGGPVSLQDTVLASLQGLPQAAHQAFFALGAFAPKPESFDRAAAERVSAAAPRTLAQLAARHLLEVDGARFALHPTVADVARTRTPSPAVEAHLEHHLQAVRAAGEDWRRIEALHGQVRWAWQRAPDGPALFQLLVHLERYQLRRGLFAERLAWAERCLAVADAHRLGASVAARLLHVVGQMQGRLGQTEAAVTSSARACAEADAAGDGACGIDARLDHAFALSRALRFEPALAAIDEALTLARAAGDRRREAETLLMASYTLRNHGRLDEAHARVLQALALFRELGDRPNEADALGLLGSIQQRSLLAGQALEQLRQAIELRRALGHDAAEADLQLGIARVHLDAGRLDQARAAGERALALAEAEGDIETTIDAVSALGDVALAAGECDAALEAYRRCATLAEGANLDAARATALENAAMAHRRRGDDDNALAELRAALDLRRAAGDMRRLPYLQRFAARCLGELGRPEEQVQTLAEALALARGLDDAKEVRSTLEALQGVARTPQGARALEAACAVLEVDRGADAEPVRARLQRRVADLRYFGPALLDRWPAVLSAEVAYADEPAPPGSLARAIELERTALQMTFGWPLQQLSIRHSRSLARGTFLLSLRQVPRQLLRPESDAAAPAVAAALGQLLRTHLKDFVGHDEVVQKLAATMPEAARRLRTAPAELGQLVTVVWTLLDERVPLPELPPVVHCFEAMRAAGADRLAIVDAVRRLPRVRPLLPGNEPGNTLLALGEVWEERLARAITLDRGQPVLALEQQVTQRCLAALREALAAAPPAIALLIENARVRRFARKLVELEHPQLAVLARDELAAPLEGRLTGRSRHEHGTTAGTLCRAGRGCCRVRRARGSPRRGRTVLAARPAAATGGRAARSGVAARLLCGCRGRTKAAGRAWRCGRGLPASARSRPPPCRRAARCEGSASLARPPARPAARAGRGSRVELRRRIPGAAPTGAARRAGAGARPARDPGSAAAPSRAGAIRNARGRRR